MCFFIKPKLTHPEEPMNPLATVENTDVEEVRQTWWNKWDVPLEYRFFWADVKITLDTDFPYPAGTYAEYMKMTLNPVWANPGVLAHEFAHISYSLLTDQQKTEFSLAYNKLKTTDSLIKYLYSIKPYGLTSDVEGHADLYRYLGDKVPKALKPYYPKLF